MIVYQLDDDPEFNILISRLFEKEFAIRIKSFTDARSFLKSVESDSPDLCLIDLNLAEKEGGGFDIIELLRKFKKNKFKIFILSGRNSADDISYGLEVGADDYLIKPMDWDQLKFKMMDTFEEFKSRERPLIETYLLDQNEQKIRLNSKFKVIKINEIGLYIQSRNLIIKGSFVKLKFDLLHEIAGVQSLNLEVRNSKFHNDEYIHYLEFDRTNTHILKSVRAWLGQNKGSQL